MKQIVLDTETTGLEPRQGHRIIEIGCVEIVNRRITDRIFQYYLNPEREVEDGAYEIHGLNNEFLSDKPRFKDIVQEFIEFIRDSEVIIHNAPFDVGFIDAEFYRLGSQWGKLEDYCQVTDTLLMARQKHPGQKNSLDALCARYHVDNSSRDLHGALLDARILGEVYLGMTGGQTRLSFDGLGNDKDSAGHEIKQLDHDRPRLRVIQPGPEEMLLHEQRLETISKASGGNCIWKELQTSSNDEPA